MIAKGTPEEVSEKPGIIYRKIYKEISYVNVFGIDEFQASSEA